MSKKILDKGYSEDDIHRYLAENGSGQIDQDNEGQIIIYTGLYENEDGELHKLEGDEEPPLWEENDG